MIQIRDEGGNLLFSVHPANVVAVVRQGDVPTLMLHGGHSVPLPGADMDAIAAALTPPQARPALVAPGNGHIPNLRLKGGGP